MKGKPRELVMGMCHPHQGTGTRPERRIADHRRWAKAKARRRLARASRKANR